MSYWDKEWAKRIIDKDHIRANSDKIDKITAALEDRPHYWGMKKLEIGSGCSPYALIMEERMPGWASRYVGVEQSRVAVDWVKNNKLAAICTDFIDYQTKNKFDLFMFMDVLEHIEDEEAAVAKIKDLAADKFRIFGNIPLYQSGHVEEGGFERNMDINSLADFVGKAGCTSLWHEVYGIKGYPYILFEAHN